jgi:hypothetical protein
MANKFVIEVRAKGFTNLETQLKKADSATKGYEKSTKNLRGTTTGLRRSLGALRNNILLYTFAVGAAAKITGKFIRDASRFESVKTRLVGLTGSVQKAEVAFSKFNAVAATTPFTLDDVVNAGAQLEAFGANSQMLLKEITDLAAFMGTTATEAANSFGRAFAGGAGAADILRERGILNIIKDSQGLKDLSKTTLPEFREALIKSLQDPTVGIAGSTDRLSKTFEGAFSNMKDAVTILSVEIGDTLMPSIKDATEGIGDLAKAATRFLRELKGEVALSAAVFGEGIDNILVPALASFRFEMEGLKIGELESKLKALEASMKSAAPSTLKLTSGLEDVSKAVGDSSTVITILPLSTKKAADGIITLNEQTKTLDLGLGSAMDSLLGGKNAFTEFENAASEAATATVGDMEITENSTEVIQRKIDVLKILIELERERAAVLSGGKPADDDEKLILRRAKAMKRFSDNIALAIVHGHNLGDAVVNSLKAIAAELAAQAISFAILKMFAGPGFSASKAGFDLLGAVFPSLGHSGGAVTRNGVQAFGSGGIVRGRDNIPILAQAGEFIIKRDSAQSIGLDSLRQMNETGQPSSNIVVNIHGGVVQDDYVRNELIPALNSAVNSGARINA